MNLYTIGFSQKSAEEFFKILKSNNVTRLIDIRLNNKSQLAGFTNVKHLPYFLKIHDIEYLYRPDFAPTKELLNGYKNKSISWKEYKIGYNKIIVQRNIIEKIDWNIFNNSVLLCSEPTAEQCHRRLLAEYLAQNKSEIKIKHL
ncbi:MAG: DUF488 domain-containing protein [Deltaproteobacteria bacterium]|nr:DUF488 domain-containing protein [Deltaproteobacteria bacterium]